MMRRSQSVIGIPPGIRTALLHFVETMPFHRFTYPIHQPGLWSADDRGPVCAVGAWCDDKPVGLAMGVRTKADGTALVCSIYVDKRFRHRGLGTSLLAQVESSMRLRGIQRLYVSFPRASSAAAAMERMLARLDWPRAEPDRLLCAGDNRLLERLDADWLRAPPKLPDDCDIVSWSDVTRRERLVLLASQAFNPWIPAGLDPFRFEGGTEFNSVAMRCGGEIVGWVLTQRLDASTLIYSCGYMRPDLQRRGCLVALYVEAMRRHARRSDIPNWRGAVPYKYRSMAAFMRRRLASPAVELEDYLVSIKALGPEAQAPHD
jgi:GNAT superfamily N-acetyltransferase